VTFRRCLFVFAWIAFLTIPCVAQDAPPRTGDPHAPESRTVSAVFDGPRVAVFDTAKDACEQTDIPDVPARAFRDAEGMVHLFATHHVARASVGPTPSVNVFAYHRDGLFDHMTGFLRTSIDVVVPNAGRWQRLSVCWTPCRFGGERPWFECRCGHNVADLYSPGGGQLACRHCYGLTYRTRQATPHDRNILAAQRLRMRLGGSGDLTQPFPSRPKGVHHKSYRAALRFSHRAG
jgi:hypothetical protein